MRGGGSQSATNFVMRSHQARGGSKDFYRAKGGGKGVRIASGNPSANPILQMDQNGVW
jgi:hypothetical protein